MRVRAIVKISVSQYLLQVESIITNLHLQATPAAVAASGGSKGDPLYAELEHKKGKQSNITPEMTV